MKRTALSIIILAWLAESAGAVTATGHSGLALAGVVAAYSPTLERSQKRAIAQLFDGRTGFNFPTGHTIDVVADQITCKAGDVDISARSCTLKFGDKTIDITGRRANELYATMIEAGVHSDSAAGAIYESLKALNCTIDPAEIRQNTGSGASCAFTGGP
jgi:hypothetical protein